MFEEEIGEATVKAHLSSGWKRLTTVLLKMKI